MGFLEHWYENEGKEKHPPTLLFARKVYSALNISGIAVVDQGKQDWP